MSAKLVQVIEVRVVKGTGTTEDRLCEVVEYWSTDGKILATQDEGAQSGPHHQDRCCCWFHSLKPPGERPT